MIMNSIANPQRNDDVSAHIAPCYSCNPDLIRSLYIWLPHLSNFMQTTPGHDYVDPTSGGVAKVAVCMKWVSATINKERRSGQSGLDWSNAHGFPEQLSEVVAYAT